jgi:8-oxo-dGTP diphosphatase
VTAVVNAAVAVLHREDGCVLLAQRPVGKAWAGWWEFPGGKVEPRETPAHALQRELDEELGTEATEFYPWVTRVFAYPERTVRLHFFMVRRWQGEPHGKENQQLSWQHPSAVTVSPLLPANAPILSALQLPPVYAITYLAEMGKTHFFASLDAALKKGLRLIQVREKQLQGEKLEQFAAEVVKRAHPFGARVLLNGDEMLAQRVGADGVHFSAAQLMACNARPQELLCGASCHNAAELRHAAELGLDFVLLSPIKPTRSHPDAHPLGWQSFSAMISDYPLPVYALGGLTEADLQNAWSYGAHGICMQRSAW